MSESVSLDLAVQPIARTRLVDEITRQLVEWILSGQVPPGTLLRQVDLSERLGVSRTPLREALRILERDGLIRMANGNKTLEVVAFSVDEVLEMYELREVVDGLAARLVAQHGLDTGIAAQLRSDVDQMEAATADADLARYRPYHAHFHSTLGECCGNARVVALVPMIRMSSQMTVTRTTLADLTATGTMPEDIQRVIVELLAAGNRDHRAILEAVLAGDAGEAENRARQHIRRGARGVRLVAEKAQSLGTDGRRGVD